MVERIMANRKNSSVTLHAVSNVSITIVGNNSVSNVATGDEILSGATVRRIWWGTDGLVSVLRGSNVVGRYTQSGYHDYVGHQGTINLDTAGSLVITMSTNSFVVVELGKIHSFMTSQT
jgi:hypothetical protein